MSINCPHCFTPNTDGAKFCKLCGNSLQAASPTAPPAQDLDFMLATMGPTVLPQPVAPPGKPPVTPPTPAGADPIVFDSFVAPPPLSLPPGLPDVEDPNATVVSWIKPSKVPAAPPPFSAPPASQVPAFEPGMFGASASAGAAASPLFSIPAGPAADANSAPARTPAEVREALFPAAAPAASTRGSGFGLIAGIAIAAVIAVAGAGYWFLAADKKTPAVAVQPPPDISPVQPPAAAPPAPVLAPAIEAAAPAPVIAPPVAPQETAAPASPALVPAPDTTAQAAASSPAEVAAKAAAASAARARQAARLAAAEKARAEAAMKKEPTPPPATPAPAAAPVVAAPAAPAPTPAPAPVAVRAPRDVCGDKLLGAFVQCMDQQCRASNHPQCTAFKRQQRENEKARNPDAY